jgi:uncharacterized membrane protein YphA (DoxX/SURF4 family)
LQGRNIFVQTTTLNIQTAKQLIIKSIAMKKTNIAYWIFTSLFAFIMLGSAIPDIVSAQIAVEGFGKMGLPAYLVPFVGIAKTLGAIAILLPGNPRLKEWAYAGLVIDLVGATYSIISSGQPASAWAPMALPLFFAAASYFFYRKRANMKAAQFNLHSAYPMT